MSISPELRSYYDFLDALSHLERLVTVRSSLIYAYSDIDGVGKVILQKIEELVSCNSMVSNHDCCTMLDRLIDIQVKISKQSQDLEYDMSGNHSVESHLQWGGVLDHLVELKLDNLIALASSEFKVDLLERLADIARRLPDSDVTTIISKKIDFLAAKDLNTTLSDIVSSKCSRGDILTPEGSEDETTENEPKNADQRNDTDLVRERVEELQRCLRGAESDINILTLELAEVKRTNTSLAQENQNIRGSLDDNASEKNTISRDLTRYQHKNKRLEEEVKNLQDALNNSNCHNSSLSHQEITEAEERYCSHEKAIEELRDSLYETRSDNKALSKGPTKPEKNIADYASWSKKMLGSDDDEGRACPTDCGVHGCLTCDPRKSNISVAASRAWRAKERANGGEVMKKANRPKRDHLPAASPVDLKVSLKGAESLRGHRAWDDFGVVEPADEDIHSNIDDDEGQFGGPEDIREF